MCIKPKMWARITVPLDLSARFLEWLVGDKTQTYKWCITILCDQLAGVTGPILSILPGILTHDVVNICKMTGEKREICTVFWFFSIFVVMIYLVTSRIMRWLIGKCYRDGHCGFEAPLFVSLVEQEDFGRYVPLTNKPFQKVVESAPSCWFV